MIIAYLLGIVLLAGLTGYNYAMLRVSRRLQSVLREASLREASPRMKKLVPESYWPVLTLVQRQAALDIWDATLNVLARRSPLPWVPRRSPTSEK